MKRIRLDIGALAASPQDGGSFMFFLYREGMDRCLPVSLTPPQMHTMLSNFKIDSNEISVHGVFTKVMQSYRIELLEVEIIRDNTWEDAAEGIVNDKQMEPASERGEENGGFRVELLFFDGESEVREVAGFVDGIVLSKQFGAPIYISEELMDRYSQGMDDYSKEVLDAETLLKKLNEELQQAIDNEEYEKAAEITKRIEKLKKGK